MVVALSQVEGMISFLFIEISVVEFPMEKFSFVFHNFIVSTLSTRVF